MSSKNGKMALRLIIDRSKGYKYNRSQPGKDEIYQKEQ